MNPSPLLSATPHILHAVQEHGLQPAPGPARQVETLIWPINRQRECFSYLGSSAKEWEAAAWGQADPKGNVVTA